MHGIAQKSLAFARLFSEWCVSRGCSPDAGAVKLGYSPDIGRKWVRGISVPPVPKVALLAKGMGLPFREVSSAIETARHERKRIAGK